MFPVIVCSLKAFHPLKSESLAECDCPCGKVIIKQSDTQASGPKDLDWSGLALWVILGGVSEGLQQENLAAKTYWMVQTVERLNSFSYSNIYMSIHVFKFRHLRLCAIQLDVQKLIPFKVDLRFCHESRHRFRHRQLYSIVNAILKMFY